MRARATAWWRAAGERDGSITPLSMQDYVNYFTYQGIAYYTSQATSIRNEREEVGRNYTGYAQSAFKSNSAVFAATVTRMYIFSQPRLAWQRLRAGKTGDLYGTPDLAILEQPWPNGTTQDLLARMELDVTLAGNFFGARSAGPSIKRLHPEWTSIVLRGRKDLSPSMDPTAEVVGYIYYPGGRNSGRDPIAYDVSEVCHYAPIPDPEASYRGMSWLQPVVNEIIGHKIMTQHQIKSMEKGGTPNTAVLLPETIKTVEGMKKWIEAVKDNHPTMEQTSLFLGGGADIKTIGANFEELQLATTQGHLETLIAAASGIPPVIIGFSEGLQSATYSNYGQARRRAADGTLRPLWGSACGALQSIVPAPDSSSRLWYDETGVAFLKEDLKDAAEIFQRNAISAKQLTDAGYTGDSVTAAIAADDFTLLEHTGLPTVQVQKNGSSNGQAEVTAGAPA